MFRWLFSVEIGGSQLLADNKDKQALEQVKNDLASQLQATRVEIPAILQENYERMDPKGQAWIIQMQQRLYITEQVTRIQVGEILLEAQATLKNQGARNTRNGGLTFEKFCEANNISRASAYRFIAVAQGFHRLQEVAATDHADLEMMIANFQTLPIDQQAAIGKKPISEEEVALLQLPKSEWDQSGKKVYSKVISDFKKQRKALEKENAALKDQNRVLSKKLIEKDDVANEKGKKVDLLTAQKHHLEIELTKRQRETPETIETLPADFEDVSGELQLELDKTIQERDRLRNQLDEATAKLGEVKFAQVTAKNVVDLEKQIEALNGRLAKADQEKDKLQNQLAKAQSPEGQAQQALKKANQAVTSMLGNVAKALDFSTLEDLLPTLSEQQVEKTDLKRVYDLLIDKARFIQERFLIKDLDVKRTVTDTVIDGEFQEKEDN